MSKVHQRWPRQGQVQAATRDRFPAINSASKTIPTRLPEARSATAKLHVSTSFKIKSSSHSNHQSHWWLFQAWRVLQNLLPTLLHRSCPWSFGFVSLSLIVRSHEKNAEITTKSSCVHMDKESVRLRFPCPCSMLLAISEAGKYRYLYCHLAQ